MSLFNSNKPKHKVEIVIFMDEQGGVGVNSTSQNLNTIFGMLEMAKKAYMQASLLAELKPKSDIVIAAPSLIHQN